MRKFLLLIALPVVAMVAGCNKDQTVVKHLDGKWKTTSVTYDGVAAPSEDYAGVTYSFTTCKVAKGDCNGTMSYTDATKGNIDFPFTYSISDKGTKIMIKVNFLGQTDITNGDIIEHSKTKFIYSVNEDETDEDGDPTGKKILVVQTLEKM
jgi:hypothetical protein